MDEMDIIQVNHPIADEHKRDQAKLFQSQRGNVSYATNNAEPDLIFHNAQSTQIIPKNSILANLRMLNRTIRNLNMQPELYTYNLLSKNQVRRN